MIDLPSLPHQPGCYLFKDSKEVIIYIGKAKDIRKRVSSYFFRTLDPKTERLKERITAVDTIVTDSEVEALVLENNLIKKHTPKYNIDLKDSRRYAYIELTKEEFPRLLIARRTDGKGEYFGPFVSGEKRDYVIDILRKTFRIRTCKRLPKRACLRYHIGICDAPCVGKQNSEDYAAEIDAARRVLKGDGKKLVGELKRCMSTHAHAQEFEQALMLRNQVQAIEWMGERQNVERQKDYNEDIINFMVKDDAVYLMLFSVVRGVLGEKQEFVFPWHDTFLEEFLVQYYADNPVPREIQLPVKVDASVSGYLKLKRAGVKVRVPQRGEKKELLELVKKNISLSFFGGTEKMLDLQSRLRLNGMPTVIECFDISHLSGTATVGSMVQFRNGLPDKSNYRRFKIRTVQGVDDFAAIAEVVTRRYRRLRDERSEMPHLVVIDGGKGQLSAAIDALRSLEVRLPIISLAKREEEVFLPGRQRSIKMPPRSKAILLLRQIRDEAHRFAINYNRLLRKKAIRG
ncbi:MAG: excinuclease ABC subunit UvrC [archaeon]